MNEIIVKLRFVMPSLSKTERNVAEALMENPEQICEETLAEFGARIHGSDASIIRFCRKMGYSGYTELKMAISKAFGENRDVLVEDVKPTDSVLDNLKQIYQSNVQILQDTMLLASNEYEAAVTAIMNAHIVNFFGAGDAGVIAKLFEFKFKRCGIRCSAQEDPVFQLIEAQNMDHGDVAIIISYTGRSYNVLNAAKAAKEKGATIISITKMSKSPLVEISDINLFIATSDFTLGKEIIIRRTAEQMILDAIYVTMMVRNEKYGQRLGETAKGYTQNKIGRSKKKSGRKSK